MIYIDWALQLYELLTSINKYYYILAIVAIAGYIIGKHENKYGWYKLEPNEIPDWVVHRASNWVDKYKHRHNTNPYDQTKEFKGKHFIYSVTVLLEQGGSHVAFDVTRRLRRKACDNYV